MDSLSTVNNLPEHCSFAVVGYLGNWQAGYPVNQPKSEQSFRYAKTSSVKIALLHQTMLK
jgi:hypothetical protein